METPRREANLAVSPQTASVRTVVEYALLSGSLMPGSQLLRMREGMRAHQARQRAVDARAEVFVSAEISSGPVALTVSGRIDLLYDRQQIPVIEEIKLAPIGAVSAPDPAHRAQAICYGYLLCAPCVIIKIAYVTGAGDVACAFEERMSRRALSEEFFALLFPYLSMLEERARWAKTRDASLRALSFPYGHFRSGQREMAVQSYWAMKTKKRLFLQAPTGIGKTAAALYPALKALGEGDTGQIFYLTARQTAQENAAATLYRMREGGLRLRALHLTAKEKICPLKKEARSDALDNPKPNESATAWRCDVLECPLAQGFFDRLRDALCEMRQHDDWSREAILRVSGAHSVCPFEFSLSLCEEADLVVCDYNYAFDPAVRIRRIFLLKTNLTLLIDEAHNMPDRAREMLSATVEEGALREIRRSVGKSIGRKSPLYRSLTALIGWIHAREAGASGELPSELAKLLTACADEALSVAYSTPLLDLPRTLLSAIAAAQRFDAAYTFVTKVDGKNRAVTLLCLDPSPHIREATKRLSGCIFFSATLTPLSKWRDVIGGDDEDGLLSLPSPFPPENLLVLRYPVSTRYKKRDETAKAVADAIITTVSARPGNYLACFPSHAYLQRILHEIEPESAGIALLPQKSHMSTDAREAYLAAFQPRGDGALLGLIVLGGVFGEGVDLPGDRLSGVIVVGVGLPQICQERELLRAFYQDVFADGFAHAYRYPGMNRVLQAVGRVIRTERDLGVALLIDDRFFQADYAALMPPWWGEAPAVYSLAELRRKMEEFWQCNCSM